MTGDGIGHADGMTHMGMGWKRRSLRAALRDRRGSTLALMAAGLIPAIAAIGSAIDISRIYLVRSQMQSGVDAAALAGARSFGNQSDTDAGRDRQVDIYFAENFPDGYLGTPEVDPEREFATQDGINVTTVSAAVALPMAFMRIFGIDERLLSVTARAEMQPKPLEVMVVLDDTGSMQTKDVGGGSRMDALKVAMRSFNETLHQGAETRRELAMGFVTYNVTTNVGDILKRYGVAVEPIDGFTNVGTYTGGASDRTNPLGWMGCVETDVTKQDLSSAPGTFEDGAWDIRSTLPGETVNGKVMPAIRPYHYFPVARLQTTANTYSTNADTKAKFWPGNEQSNTSDGRTNNHYLLSPGGDMAIGERLANTQAYRQFFYDFYIGLNKASGPSDDDVIVRSSDGGFFDPSSGSGDWKVNYSRIPYIDDTRVWAQPNPKYGYPINSATRIGHTLKMSQPNWQCPEPAMMIEYGRSKQAYLDYINQENFPVMPASGTLHHIGFLWGYRILTRDTVFTRVNPIPTERPLRALVFMTDGETSVSSAEHWYGAYGRLRDKRITASTNTGTFQGQIMRRFAKVCEAAKRDGITVYIVSLKANVPEFSTCAGSRYYRTENAATIQQAFQQIAVDLVDLHLTQ